MDTPNINQIKAMTPEERDALQKKAHRKLAAQVVGFIFLKLSISGVARVLATKAIIEAAKRV